MNKYTPIKLTSYTTIISLVVGYSEGYHFSTILYLHVD